MKYSAKLFFNIIAVGFSLGVASCSSYIEKQAGKNFEPKIDNLLKSKKSSSEQPSVVTGAIFSERSQKSGLLVGMGTQVFKVGEIIRVKLNEANSATKNQSLTSAKQSSVAANVPDLSAESTNTNRLPRVVERTARTLNLLNGMTSDKSFTGTGTSALANTLSGELATIVVKRYANGNLKLVGQKKLTLTSGTEYIRVVGIARPEFIDQDNIIDSKNLANAEIQYIDANSVRKGWLTEMMDEVSPL
ncbi:MAG: hypothetical protein CMM44_04460 [Rhodospirillaceae bacterium]|nr:hypothetical protein [Rhodospirillaceae bacterium]|tara:strand:- start:6966 stop:7703 length:738 start_codon:yes stop_codon:yes gene_type:complete